MTVEQTIFALIAGAVASIGVTLAGAWASRKFGLPGLARSVDTVQERFVRTLKDELAEVRTQLTDETSARRRCGEEINRLRLELRDTKRDLRDTEAELLTLYRETGRRPSRRLQERVESDQP